MTFRKLPIFIFVLICTILEAQVYKIDQSAEVIENGNSLGLPWAGGLNSGQYNTMDVDRDGLQDLVIFDRTASKINVFRNNGGSYMPTFDYSDQFPENLNNWVLLRDYNCDGKKDLFVRDPLGMRVYENVSDEEGLKWRLFNDRGPQSPLRTLGLSGPTNLQLNSSDIPSITDVDGDGDLDILNFRFTGRSTIQYHKNFSMERSGNCDSLQLELITQSWGEFEQCLCEQMLFGGEQCGNIGGRTKHQAGKSLLTFDIDNDGDQDAIVSEEDCNLLNFLRNDGNASDALMTENSTSFPSAQNPAILFSFPAAYYEDVDFDGLNDLLVAPNLAANIGVSVNFKQSSWFYKNTGSITNPQFQLIQRDFLQDQMLDFGENAVPAFYDYDADGDLDLFVSNNIDLDLGLLSTLKLYENIGTPTAPKFELKETDFLNLSASLELFNLKPTFSDVDNNGTQDLVLSGSSNSNLATSIFYLKNSSARGLSLNLTPNLLFTLSDNRTAENFKLFDIDGDGNQDLIVGRRSGQLEYYRNLGSAEQPDFVLEESEFLGFGISPFTINSSIDISDIDGDGSLDIIIADERGNFSWVSDFKNKIGTEIEPQDILFEKTNDSAQIRFKLGTRLVPRVVNLFNEDKPAIVVGTGQGGMNILRNSGAEVQPLPNLSTLIFPNPAVNQKRIFFRTDKRTFGYVVSLTGQRLTETQVLEAGKDNIINISGLAEGLYILVTTENGDDFNSLRFMIDR